MKPARVLQPKFLTSPHPQHAGLLLQLPIGAGHLHETAAILGKRNPSNQMSFHSPYEDMAGMSNASFPSIYVSVL